MKTRVKDIRVFLTDDLGKKCRQQARHENAQLHPAGPASGESGVHERENAEDFHRNTKGHLP